MTWFKVDDAFHGHPKVAALEAGRHFAESIALWTLAGSWSAHHLTDGFVPMTVLRRVVPFAPARAATELVRVGLWETADGGYRFKDWIHYQPTKQEVESSRTSSAKRSRKYRELQKSRVASRVTEAVTNGVSNGGRTLAPSRTFKPPAPPCGAAAAVDEAFGRTQPDIRLDVPDPSAFGPHSVIAKFNERARQELEAAGRVGLDVADPMSRSAADHARRICSVARQIEEARGVDPRDVFVAEREAFFRAVNLAAGTDRRGKPINAPFSLFAAKFGGWANVG